MQQEPTKLRINFSALEVEVAGSEENVRKWMETLDPYINAFAVRSNVKESKHPEAPSGGGGEVGEPAVFGEYLQQFPSNLSDTDRVLVAGYFAQRQSEDNRFTTGDARRLL